jgi:type III restriction enzyme
MTQLVGRILRQPQAAKTGIPLLDECHIYCLHETTKDVVAGIKKGLENDGLADLAVVVKGTDGVEGEGLITRKLPRRPVFKDAHIFLPRVLWQADGEARPLDYEQDVLSRVDWTRVDMSQLAIKIPRTSSAPHGHMTRIGLTDGTGKEFFTTAPVQDTDDFTKFDAVHATRIIADIVPNPWLARQMVGQLVEGLWGQGFDAKLVDKLSSLIIEMLRKHLADERDALAEQCFLADVAAERIQFRLRMDNRGLNWAMPHDLETDRPVNAVKLSQNSGDPIAKSVFAPVYADDFNSDEAGFACYLEEQKALRWWHRNVAKAGHYAVQGWRRNKVYPDFIFAFAQTEGGERIYVIETKGDQLAGNLDSEYKKKLLNVMSESYQQGRTTGAGTFEVELGDKKTVVCELVLMSEWKGRAWG